MPRDFNFLAKLNFFPFIGGRGGVGGLKSIVSPEIKNNFEINGLDLYSGVCYTNKYIEQCNKFSIKDVREVLNASQSQ